MVKEVDPGMVEASMALAGIAGAIALFLPTTDRIAGNLRLYVGLLASIMAVFSAYSALLFLARYCLKKESETGAKEILLLLLFPIASLLNSSSTKDIPSIKLVPYWIVAVGLAAWFVMSVILIIFAY
jgi:hypothetical protein